MGRKLTPEIKEKMRLAHLGKKFTEEHKKKLGLSKRGEKNCQWKGDDIGYFAVHKWVRRNLPMPELCQMCNKVKPDVLANVTGIYTRDFVNWKYICHKCHYIIDSKSHPIGVDGRFLMCENPMAPRHS